MKILFFFRFILLLHLFLRIVYGILYSCIFQFYLFIFYCILYILVFFFYIVSFLDIRYNHGLKKKLHNQSLSSCCHSSFASRTTPEDCSVPTWTSSDGLLYGESKVKKKKKENCTLALRQRVNKFFKGEVWRWTHGEEN